MRNSKIIFIFFCVLNVIACKKPNNPPSSILGLIQHKWALVSHNGEALRYVGNSNDYYDFNSDNNLYRFIDSVRDTSAYSLLSDGKTLLLYPITNGIKSSTSLNYTIKKITQNQFIISYSASPIFVLDSLKR